MMEDEESNLKSRDESQEESDENLSDEDQEQSDEEALHFEGEMPEMQINDAFSRTPYLNSNDTDDIKNFKGSMRSHPDDSFDMALAQKKGKGASTQ